MSEDQPPRSNPYPGLRPFQSDETHLFFGRDEQRTQLLGRLRQSRFLAVVGTSGSGKSSLVKAGLLSGLYGGFMAGGGSRWRIVDTRPGSDPIGRLATALDKDVVPGSDTLGLSFTEATLRRSALGLVDAVREARLPSSEKVLVLVDQFEELFRFLDKVHGQKPKNDAAAFVQLLLEAARQDAVPIYVVLTMRSDFLGDCARFRDLPEAINDGQYLIPRLTRRQLREAIVGPAAVLDGQLSPTLVNRLLNDVGDNPDQLPILQHALMRTWDHWKDSEADECGVALQDYLEIGGMGEALSNHADAVLAELSKGGPTEETTRRRLIAERLFKCLTESTAGGRGVRRLARVREVAEVADVDVEEVISVADMFRQPSNCFLMPPISEELTAESYLDISHESLLRNWRTLRAWAEYEAESAKTYKRLAQTAVLHHDGDADPLAERGLRVVRDWEARQRPTAAWAKRYDPEFDLAMSFLDTSKEQLEAKVEAKRLELRRVRRIRASAWIGGILAILLPLQYFYFQNESERDRIKSQDEAHVAADRALVQLYDLAQKATSDEAASERPQAVAGPFFDDLYRSPTHLTFGRALSTRFFRGGLSPEDGLLATVYRYAFPTDQAATLSDAAGAVAELARDYPDSNHTLLAKHAMQEAAHRLGAQALDELKEDESGERLRLAYRYWEQPVQRMRILNDLLGLQPEHVHTSQRKLEEAFSESEGQIKSSIAYAWLAKRLREIREDSLPADHKRLLEIYDHLGHGHLDEARAALTELENDTAAEATDGAERESPERSALIFLANESISRAELLPEFERITFAARLADFQERTQWRGTFQKRLWLLALPAALLSWLIWGWIRKRFGKIAAIKTRANPLRRLAAVLVDVLVSLLLGASIGALLGFFVAIGSGLLTGSFISTTPSQMGPELVGLFVAIPVGLAVMICYLLFRDAIAYRYRRSFGKILLRLRPVTVHGEPVSMRISAHRNWMLVMGLFGGAFFGLLLMCGGVLPLMFIIGLFVTEVVLSAKGAGATLHDRLAKTRVIDVRSESATPAALRKAAADLPIDAEIEPATE